LFLFLDQNEVRRLIVYQARCGGGRLPGGRRPLT
jgi:hypothetical protein